MAKKELYGLVENPWLYILPKLGKWGITLPFTKEETES